jgi:predicted kinase
MYGSEAVDLTYRRLADHCRTGLRAGFNMIADGTFLQRRHRLWFVDLARSLGVRCYLLDCTAPEQVLRNRIRSRMETRKDASDADQAVLDFQLSHHDPLSQAEGMTVITLPHDSDPNQILRELFD